MVRNKQEETHARNVPYWSRLMIVLVGLSLHAFFAIAIMQSTEPIGVDWYIQVQPPWITDLLADTIAGGSIAWALGEVPTFLLLVIVAVMWAKSDTRLAKQIDRAADRDGDADLKGVDAVILPGGFSYGDYLRCGAISRFAPVMTEIIAQANKGMPLLGICNGFQVLCEAHLLPGALTRNHELHFLCRDQTLKIENTTSAWTSNFTKGQEIVIPLKNGEGSFQCDDETLKSLEDNNRIIARYVGENTNGSRNLIAGITNERGNVVGLMPHPEHAIDSLTGPSTDGLPFFTSVLTALVGK